MDDVQIKLLEDALRKAVASQEVGPPATPELLAQGVIEATLLASNNRLAGRKLIRATVQGQPALRFASSEIEGRFVGIDDGVFNVTLCGDYITRLEQLGTFEPTLGEPFPTESDVPVDLFGMVTAVSGLHILYGGIKSFKSTIMAELANVLPNSFGYASRLWYLDEPYGGVTWAQLSKELIDFRATGEHELRIVLIDSIRVLVALVGGGSIAGGYGSEIVALLRDLCNWGHAAKISFVVALNPGDLGRSTALEFRLEGGAIGYVEATGQDKENVTYSGYVRTGKAGRRPVSGSFHFPEGQSSADYHTDELVNDKLSRIGDYELSTTARLKPSLRTEVPPPFAPVNNMDSSVRVLVGVPSSPGSPIDPTDSRINARVPTSRRVR